MRKKRRWKRFRRPRKYHPKTKPPRNNVCSYCGKEFVELPHRCKFCGELICSDHLLPENHECKKLPPRIWPLPVPEIPTQAPVSIETPSIEAKSEKHGKLKFMILNGIKYLGGGLFSIGCFATWVALVGPFVARYVIPDLSINSLLVWEQGIFLTCIGFALFLLGWILSKASSIYGFRYRDWRAKRIIRVMGSLFLLTIVVWLVSYLVLKIQPAYILFADFRPVLWILGFFFAFILTGSYMKKIREGRMGILNIFSPALTFLGVVGAFGLFIFVWYAIPFLIQNPQLMDQTPPGYYESAEVYVTLMYGNTNQTYNGLESFLMKLESFPPYSMNVFDCSESSSLLEWLLEGAGFNTFIAMSSFYETFPHTWVVVILPDGKHVSIEATYFTLNYYYPPGIVSGQHLLGFDTRVDYDNPSEVYESPIDATRRITVYVERSEWDWWNIAPYNNMEPFASWN